jgi:O-antigen/teichoic acid export membrane protein
MSSTTSGIAVRGAKWIGFCLVLQKALNALILVVLARLLSPSDFGAVGLAVGIITPLIMLKEVGMTNALIQTRDSVEETANAFFWISLALAAPLYLLIFALSPTVGEFFGDSRLVLLLRLLGLQLVIESIKAVPRTLAVRDLKTREQFFVNSSEYLTNGVVAVIFAMEGWGAASLALGMVLSALVGAVLWWSLTAWRPTSRFDWQVTRKSVSYGSVVASAELLQMAVDSLGRVFIGGLLGMIALGYYDLAVRLVFLPLRSVARLLGHAVAFPLLSQIQKDREEVRRLSLKAIRFSVLLMMPFTLTLALLGDPLVPLLLGEKWQPAAPLVQILSPFAVLLAFSDARPIYKALRRPRLLLILAASHFLAAGPVLFFAAKRGLQIFCAAEISLIAFLSLANLFWIGRLISVPARDFLLMLRTPVRAAIVVAGIAGLSRYLVPEFYAASNLLTVLVTASVCFLVYWAAVILVDSQAMREVRSLVSLFIFPARQGAEFRTAPHHQSEREPVSAKNH